MIYKARGEHDKALKHYERALKIGKELGDKAGMATDYNNIGMIYNAKHDYRTALNYLQKTLSIEEQIGIDTSVTRKNIESCKQKMQR